MDPIRGDGQKGENVWMQVHDKFCIMQQKELVKSGQHIQVQAEDSIEQRWKKRISKSVQLWNKHYKQLKGMNKSGWNEEKYVKEASNFYKGETRVTARKHAILPCPIGTPLYSSKRKATVLASTVVDHTLPLLSSVRQPKFL